jgi:hypothetical protein
VILSLHESHDACGMATLRFADPVANAEAVNLTEDPGPSLDVTLLDDWMVQVPVRPFQIVTPRKRM